MITYHHVQSCDNCLLLYCFIPFAFEPRVTDDTNLSLLFSREFTDLFGFSLLTSICSITVALSTLFFCNLFQFAPMRFTYDSCLSPSLNFNRSRKKRTNLSFTTFSIKPKMNLLTPNILFFLSKNEIFWQNSQERRDEIIIDPHHSELNERPISRRRKFRGFRECHLG